MPNRKTDIYLLFIYLLSKAHAARKKRNERRSNSTSHEAIKQASCRTKESRCLSFKVSSSHLLQIVTSLCLQTLRLLVTWELVWSKDGTYDDIRDTKINLG